MVINHLQKTFIIPLIATANKIRHSIPHFDTIKGILGPIFIAYRKRLFFGLGAMLLVDIFQLFIPRIIRSTVDGLNQHSLDTTSLWHNGLLIIVLALAVGLFRFCWRYLMIGFSRLLERDIRNQLFSHLLTLDKAFFQKRTIGDLMALATNDLGAVQLACGMGLVALVDAIIMVFAGLACMLYIHPLLTLAALVPMPLLAIFTKVLAKKLHIRFRKVQEKFAAITEFARTAITSIRLLKIYNLENSQVSHFNTLGEDYVNKNIKVARIQGTLFPVSTLIANTSLLIVVFFGGRLTIDQEITIGDFVAFINYLFMMTWPMMAIGWVTNLFQRGHTSLERITNIINEEATLKSHSTFSPENLAPEITIRNLSFTYPAGNVTVLKDISLDIGPGLLGIVGPTGSGKSTLIDLLSRLYEIPDDTVFVGGVDVNLIKIHAVRKMISFVPQNNQLFSDTIAFNISLACPSASLADIEHCAKMAMIHKEILSLSSGYQTRIGEKGVKLSGGQRQRIILAQALLADRPILLIDDGLSAVDVETERAIINNLAAMCQDKTIVFISHRLAPLAGAHKIVVLEDGRITAMGSQQELLQKNSFFQTIHHHQT